MKDALKNVNPRDKKVKMRSNLSAWGVEWV